MKIKAESHDKLIQLKQQIIHYKSEATKFEREANEMKRLAMQYKEQSIMQKKELEEQLTIKKELNTSITAYFSYSLILPREEGENIKIIGNFIVLNSGTTLLTSPVICLRITPATHISLAGKIASNNEAFAKDSYITESEERWKYVNNEQQETKSNDEHWLVPLHLTELEPGKSLSFTNFEIDIQKSEAPISLIIEGFAYFFEWQQGEPSINQIVLNL
ncbi:MAG TPA: hypothetical protein GX525_09575 [Bacilli bacterium]|nr:hypothetical protein [Bacilli bacterium]